MLAAEHYVLNSGLTSGGANTVPIGTALSLGQPAQASNSLCTVTTVGACYSLTIEAAGTSASTGNVHFSVRSGGSPIGSQPTITLVSLNGTSVSVWNGVSWTSSVAFNSTETLILSAGSSVAGDQLVAIGVGALQGTTAYNLP